MDKKIVQTTILGHIREMKAKGKMTACLNSIVIEDECYVAPDLSKSEIEEFFLDLNTSEFRDIVNNFMTKMPQLEHTIKVEREDKSSFEVQLKGLNSFR